MNCMKKIAVYGKFLDLLRLALPYLHKSIWFNFRYFPFRQAVRLPVLILSKSSLTLGGKCILDVPRAHFGMIKLGQNFHTNRPDTGFFFCNYGGTVRFSGSSSFGRCCCITIGEKGVLKVGDNVVMSYGALIYAYHSVVIGNRVRVGWDSVLMDTSFHFTKTLAGGRSRGYGSVEIGSNVWIPAFCRLLPNAKLPDYCIIGGGSIVNKDYSDCPIHILLAGNPLKIKKQGVYRDFDDDNAES